MNEKTLIDFLALQNPWWYHKTDFPVTKVHSFKRKDFYYLRNCIPQEEATLILGPRGVGKSTVLFELIRELLGLPEEVPKDWKSASIRSTGIPEKRILYVIFDEPVLRKLSIRDILDSYAKLVLGEDLSRLKGQTYVFLDEIQNVADWGEQVTSIQNLKLPIKFFITGSSSSGMLDEAAKAARRIHPQVMLPLKFADFVAYKLWGDAKLRETLKDISLRRDEIIGAYNDNNPEAVRDLYLRLYADLKFWQVDIERLFGEYLVKGGYPGLMDVGYEKGAEILKDTYYLGFRKDAIRAKGIGDPAGLSALAQYVAAISGGRTNLTSLLENSLPGSNTDVVKRYLYHLESCYLASRSMMYSRSNKSSNEFKVYLADVALRNLLIGRFNDLLGNDQVEYGRSLETLIYDHMKRLQFKVNSQAELSYWMDKRSRNEIDVILRLNDRTMPVEVKKEDNPSVQSFKVLGAFCKKECVGTVICGKKLALEDRIVFVPHWLFALIC